MAKRISLNERREQEQAPGRGFATIINGPKRALAVQTEPEAHVENVVAQPEMTPAAEAVDARADALVSDPVPAAAAPVEPEPQASPPAGADPHSAPHLLSGITLEQLEAMIQSHLQQPLPSQAAAPQPAPPQAATRRKKAKTPLIHQELFLLSDEVTARLNAEWEKEPRRGGKSKSRLADEIFRHYFKMPPIDYD